MNRFAVILVCSIVFPGRFFSQTSPIIIGKVSHEELRTVPDTGEKGAEATVLCDFATAKIIYNNGFGVEFTRHVRIKIFKSSGYGLTNIQIPFTRFDRLLDLKAFTYNLEGDQSVKVAVGKKQIHVEKVDPYHNMIRFTFPNIREGSVIEYSYTIIQGEIDEFRRMRFQRTIPVRHVEYWASIPEFFQYYIYLNQNDFIQFQHVVEDGYYNTLPTKINLYKWSGYNLPAFEPEPLMPEGEEYMIGVDFALSSIQYPGVSYLVSPTYARLSEELLNSSIIGHQIENTLLFTGKVGEIIQQQDSQQKKMRTIYEYVQQHMKWNGNEQLWPDRPLAKAYHEGTGTSAEINLILVNMLRTVGITADPVMLSTRDNGRIKPLVAIAGNLNYLICCATIEGKDYLLDATDKLLPAGMLPFKCLNIRGWVMSKTRGRWVNLLNQEKYATQEYYDLTLNEKNELTGHAIVTFSGYDAINLRRLIHNEGEAGFRAEKIAHAGNITISDLKFTDMDSLHLPLRITFDITIRHTLKKVNQEVFFKPQLWIFGNYINTWIKAERKLPVDQGCPSTERLNCRIRLPDHYLVEELPKTIRIRMPDNAADFLFGTETIGNTLVIACELNVNKAFFETQEYPALREFYTQVNKKCNEMVILKEN